MTDKQETPLIQHSGGSQPENLWALIERKVHQLYPAPAEQVGLLMTICKAVLENKGGEPTNAPLAPGMKAHPFDFEAASRLKIINVHHSTCIAAQKMAMAGLGHENDKVAKTLGPLCPKGMPWLVLLLKVVEDYAQFGNAYLEVVRNGDTIVGLHHLPARDVKFVLEEDRVNGYWSIRGGDVAGANAQGGSASVMAKFGDLVSFRTRHAGLAPQRVSEVIQFIDPTNANRFYGMPDWLAAVASMELVQALHQHQFDFHVNRGVPEFIMLLTGGRVDTKTWAKLTASLQSHVGVGNSHKSSVFNLTDPDIKVQIEQLAMAGIENGAFFQTMSETLSVNIVSAHRTPPSIAGIMIPGKMGAANETSNAIMAYQALKIGPAQTIIEQILDATLGSDEAGLGLAPGDFDLKTIVDEMSENMAKLKPVDTMGGMKQELPEAAAEGRDLNDGLKQ